jgi:hypothetical protein
MELVDILSNLDAPAILIVLGYFLYRSDGKLKEKEDEIKSLNEYIRLSDKENIKTLSEFGKFLESLIANVDTIKGELAREISHSAEMVKNKIDNLKTIIESKNEPR